MLESKDNLSKALFSAQVEEFTLLLLHGASSFSLFISKLATACGGMVEATLDLDLALAKR